MTSNALIFRISFILSMIIALFFTGFSLISGSESYGEGIKSIIQNSPNALPWIIYILLLILSWKFRKPATILLVIFAVGLLWFFNFSGPNFFAFTFVLTLVILILALAMAYFGNKMKVKF